MSREPYDPRVMDLLGQIIELPPSQRASGLDELCGHDPELRRRVQALLDHRSATAVPSSIALDQPSDAPSAIGPYRLIELIGEGGMGSVYRAEQREPVRRIVAVKLIKLGMDTRQVVARFDSERQALAMMNHPNVAKVLDGGATDMGRPYFVMEYVAGEPITAYCDRHRLGTEQRLELFRQVCDAVQHAHHKGIIHRDLKPSNVLVGLEDGKPVPKVIDFGVAKAVSQRLTERSFFTERGQLVGTPEYMSPEQAEMGALDVDTRSDVYSLGVLLYELLTGALPFDPKSLRQAAFGEIQRIIREVDPPRPSTRLSSLGEQSETAARSRNLDTSALVKRLRGDLDWITMKAMEKDRTRRYATPSELASDLERHMRHEPAQAGPPTIAYRTRKFVRRNRGAVVAASLVILALLAGVVGTSIGLVRESRQRAEAERQRAEAQSANETAQAVNQLFQNLLVSVHPVVAQGKALLVRDVLDQAAIAVETNLTDKPLVELSTRQTLALAFSGLGEPKRALPHAAAVVELCRAHKGPNHPETILWMNNVAHVLNSLGQLRDAETRSREALALARASLGDDHETTITCMNGLAQILVALGRPREAEPLNRQAIQRSTSVFGPEHPLTRQCQNDYIQTLVVLGRWQEALPPWREALERARRELGDSHPDTLLQASALAGLLQRLGQFAEAEPLLREALQRKRQVLGDDHRDTLLAINNLAELLTSLERYSEAEALHRELLERCRRTLGHDHPDTLHAVNNLASVLEGMKQFEEAEALFRQALEQRRRILGDDHPDTVGAVNNLAHLMVSMDRLADAEPLYRQALDRSRAVNGEDHPNTQTIRGNLAMLLRDLKKFDEAEPLWREALQRSRQALGDDHPQTLGHMLMLATLLHGTQRMTDAEPLYRELIEHRRRIYGDDDPIARTLTARLDGSTTQPATATAPIPMTQP